MSPGRGERIFRRAAALIPEKPLSHGLACCFALARSRFAQPWLSSDAAAAARTTVCAKPLHEVRCVHLGQLFGFGLRKSYRGEPANAVVVHRVVEFEPGFRSERQSLW
jgi:hypothetical protein